ncbi:hypothetical protein BDU57DRAFT_554412 [Ampelomyces quisqualis]|uniref:TauD/TfdA-like domain-containing protein n=1 Tax=Ampelomyces quisqualis TaxID=50730 RepID=A0A6A5QW26_AMPQU|nr:hypothetical protein BDU57DRAFT_554412 [Ampelomyces quisqualis]
MHRAPRFVKSSPVTVPELSYSTQLDHIDNVYDELERTGILKISMGFEDENSNYLQNLLRGLHQHRGHNLPIAHSATQGWFWSIRPCKENFQARNHQARSETMEQFPWHTDCSYEDNPPRFFALQVLQHDRYGGGTLSVMNTERLIQHLSTETRNALAANEYQIDTPPEFVRNPKRTHITGSVLATAAESHPQGLIRFREDIFNPLTYRAARALIELKEVIAKDEVRKHATLHLEAEKLPKGSIVLVDNRRWLHARNVIKDPERHLRRIQDPARSGKEWSAYTIPEVLAVASCHPFYSNARYPPDQDTIRAAKLQASRLTDTSLGAWPLLKKEDLYVVVSRLFEDTDPRNTYLHNVYMSTTGGGGRSSKPLYFCTDAQENRQQRRSFGNFVRTTGLIERGDLVLSTHCSGGLYRSLDLMLEVMENAGASVLAAGHQMAPALVCQSLIDLHVNVLTGDGSQMIQIASQVSTLPASERLKLKLDKVIYTSESLTELQKNYLRKVFGNAVKIYSVLGSAEAGPYGVSNPDISSPNETSSGNTDFLIDTRETLIEVFPLTAIDDAANCQVRVPLPQGQVGLIAQTSLTRLRHPLVRYLNGDIGSIHALPEHTGAHVPEADRTYLKILRLQGRDTRFSFTWNGEYIEYSLVDALMNDPQFGVLQWQVILDTTEHREETLLEVRLLCSAHSDDASKATLSARLKDLFVVYEEIEYRFRLIFVNDMSAFERSQTGQKISGSRVGCRVGDADARSERMTVCKRC